MFNNDLQKLKDDKRKYLIYSRKSKFTGKGESVENQIEICKKYIKDHFDVNVKEEDILFFPLIPICEECEFLYIVLKTNKKSFIFIL